MKKLSDVINENLKEPSFIVNLGGMLNIQDTGFSINSEVDKKLTDIHSQKHLHKTTTEPNLNQQHKIDMGLDTNMVKFFHVLDIINCFSEFTTLFIQDAKATNKEIGWYEKQIQKSINSVNYYVEQLAKNINPMSHQIETEMVFDIDNFETKTQLATYIKKSDEWKDLKNIIKKNEINFVHQPLSIRALCMVIIKKINKFIQVMK